jgi:uncharacterized protein
MTLEDLIILVSCPGLDLLTGPPERGERTISDAKEDAVIPSVEYCFFLMDKYQMLDHIKAHSVVVARVAHLLTRRLCDAGLNLSVEKTTTAALMHDIGKTPALKSGEDHSEIGRQICLKNRLEEIAHIVGEHVRLIDYRLDDDFCEKEIVFYADKRVNHDRIVSLKERLTYIMERYGKGREPLSQRIRKNFKLCELVEEKLFSRLDFAPEALGQRVREEPLS